MMKPLYIIAGALMAAALSTSCSQGITWPESPAHKVTLPKAVAHRGCWLKDSKEFYINENCPAGVQMAARYGYPAIECDVKYTLDSVMVIMHDATINRTMRNASDYSPITEPVYVKDLTYEQLRSGYVLESTDPALRTPIPTFKEEVEACKKYGIIPMLHSSIVESYRLAQEELGENWIGFTSTKAALDEIRSFSNCLILLDPGRVPAETAIANASSFGGRFGISTMKYDMLIKPYIDSMKAAGAEVQASIFPAPHEQRAAMDGVTIQLSDFWWHQDEGRRAYDSKVCKRLSLDGGQSFEWTPSSTPDFAALTLRLDFKGSIEVTMPGNRKYAFDHAEEGCEILGVRLYKTTPAIHIKALGETRIKRLEAKAYEL